MDERIVAAIIAAVGGFISGVIGSLVVLRTKNIDRILEKQKMWVTAYDSKFLEVRIIEYRKLWKLSKPLSHLHINDLDSSKANELINKMTDWYYDDGGMFLSEGSRGAFFSARASLEESLEESYSKFSILRTALCEDLNSRRDPILNIADIQED